MTYVRKSHCKRGHKFTPSNTFIHVKNGYVARQCRRCRSLYEKERYKNNTLDCRTKAIERGKEAIADENYPPNLTIKHPPKLHQLTIPVDTIPPPCHDGGRTTQGLSQPTNQGDCNDEH